MKEKTIVICSSAAFYKHTAEIASELERAGFTSVVIPKTARAMRESGNYDVDSYKTWYDNADDYDKKADFMRAHFDEITKGDVILVVNDEKHAIKGYIGPNVLMEMSLAWYQKKPIYIFNELPLGSPFEEELKGMCPTVLHGDIHNLTKSADSSE